MNCPACAVPARPFGTNRSGTRRYRCLPCGTTFSEPRRTIGNRYLPLSKVSLAATLLAEGNSLSSTARITGIEENTVASLLAEIGAGCRRLERSLVRNVDTSHLEVDEIWTFVRKKQRRVTDSDPETFGDAYCYIGLDRDTRLVVAWHLGKRDMANTARFILKVRKAVSRKRFQISSDGWEAYGWAIEAGLSDRSDYARIVKVANPGRIEAVMGEPDLSETETTYVERINGTLRQWCKRFTRKTYAFSKKGRMLECALALAFLHYNFCRVHKTLQATPAMEAGLTDHVWDMEELLITACPSA